MVAITINGAPCDASTSHFSLSTCQIQDMGELTKLQLFRELRSASFAGTNLDDIGLAHVSRVKTIENLNLQDTEVSDAGLACLVNLPNLQYLRLKGNPQLSCSELLAHLAEVEARGIHRLRACACLYTYCVYELRSLRTPRYLSH